MKALRFSFWFVFFSLATAPGAVAKDVSFEISDGVWKDGTIGFKGFGFDTVLFGFEDYKLRNNKPDVTLVRVTPEPKFSLFWSKKDQLDPKWKVPLGPSSGHARQNFGIQMPLKEGEIEELRKRVEADLTYWKSK